MVGWPPAVASPDSADSRAFVPITRLYRQPPARHYTEGKEVTALGSLGWPEILLIVAVVVLLFGARKLPDLARSMGASAKEFRKGLEEGTDEDEEDTST